MKMLMHHAVTLGIAMAAAAAAPAAAQHTTYPPLRDYLMPRNAEISLAESAAPENIATHATIKVLTTKGFEVARTGQNGFVCVVMRGWAAPTYTPKQFRDLTYDPSVRAPICFDPLAARTVLPYYDNAMIGGNEFGGVLPQLTDDAGTPFAVVVIPVDHQLAVKSKGGTR